MNDYHPTECVTFCKTKEANGGLHNMAAGYPIAMGPTIVRTSEHLYQAMRFTAHPDIQRDLLAITSPMAAKMFAKGHADKARPDWLDIRVEVMEWVLDLKLLNNMKTFKPFLVGTGDKPIVEISRKDAFWGAIPHEAVLRGKNICGILLWLLRRRAADGLAIHTEPQKSITDFLFLGENAVSLAKDGLFI
jgi:ribA/ribD-fused uncharacterized protein